MSQKETFIAELDRNLKQYQREARTGMPEACMRNVCLTEKRGFDFDVEATFVDWAGNAGVDYAVIDVAAATQKDIETIAARWSLPTAYLFKDFGDESAGNIREKLRNFIKDRRMNFVGNGGKPQVIVCAVTIQKDRPIQDFYDGISLFTFNISC